MKQLGVFKEVKRSTLPIDVDAIDSTWVFKKKSRGLYCGRLTAR